MEQVSQAGSSNSEQSSAQTADTQACALNSRLEASNNTESSAAPPRYESNNDSEPSKNRTESKACSVDGLLSKSTSSQAGRDNRAGNTRDSATGASLREDALKSAADYNKTIGRQNIKKDTAEFVKNNVLPDVVIS